MARIYPLFSSSSGNCTYIGDEHSGILIDAGVSCKKICDALGNNGLSPEAVQGVFVTHTHSDHIQGLKVLTKKYNIPIYAQRTNLQILADNDKVHSVCSLNEINGTAVDLGDFRVEGFETPHDTPASCGYKVTLSDGKVCAVCTDLGYVTPEISQTLNGCDLVVLESNYDVQMLKNGPYPYELKRRIASDHGHLSNSDCDKQLCDLMDNGVCRFILGHLSQHNNTPQTAEQSAVKALEKFRRNKDYVLYVARPEGAGLAVAF